MIKLTTALVLFSITFSVTFGQTGCPISIPQDSTNWGLGLILPPKELGFAGIHRTTKDKVTVSANGHLIINQDNSTNSTRFHARDIIRVGFYFPFLKVYEIRDTQLLILTNTINGGVWVDMDELYNNDRPFFTYSTYLFDLDELPKAYKTRFINHNLGVNLFNTCLNLRDKPTVESEIITCIQNNQGEGDFHQITILEQRKKWAYIVLRRMISQPSESGDGCNFKVAKEQYGWIKALADNGYPNLWYPIMEE